MDESTGIPRWSSPREAPGREAALERLAAADGPLAGATLAVAPGGTLWCFRRPDRIEVVAAKPGATIGQVQYDGVPDLLGHYGVDASGPAPVLRWHPRPPAADAGRSSGLRPAT